MAGFAHERARHHQQRRLGDRRRRRPRHPGRKARSTQRGNGPRRFHAGRRDDRAQVRRQIRKGGLSNFRRLARRRRHGREFSLRMVRSRSFAAMATFSSKNTNAACRTGPVKRVGATTKTGTKTTFKPDAQIFQTTKFSYDILYRRLQELAFLNRGVHIFFKDEQTGQHDEFHYERGIVEFVEHLNRASEAAASRRRLHQRRARRRRLRNRPAILRRIHRERPLLRQQHQHHRRRHARLRLPLGPDAHAESIRQEGRLAERPRRPRATMSAKA